MYSLISNITNTFTAMHDSRYQRNLPKYQSLHEDVYFSKGAIQPVHLNWDYEHMPPQTLVQQTPQTPQTPQMPVQQPNNLNTHQGNQGNKIQNQASQIEETQESQTDCLAKETDKTHESASWYTQFLGYWSNDDYVLIQLPETTHSTNMKTSKITKITKNHKNHKQLTKDLQADMYNEFCQMHN